MIGEKQHNKKVQQQWIRATPKGHLLLVSNHGDRLYTLFIWVLNII